MTSVASWLPLTMMEMREVSGGRPRAMRVARGRLKMVSRPTVTSAAACMSR